MSFLCSHGHSKCSREDPTAKLALKVSLSAFQSLPQGFTSPSSWETTLSCAPLYLWCFKLFVDQARVSDQPLKVRNLVKSRRNVCSTRLFQSNVKDWYGKLEKFSVTSMVKESFHSSIVNDHDGNRKPPSWSSSLSRTSSQKGKWQCLCQRDLHGLSSLNKWKPSYGSMGSKRSTWLRYVIHDGCSACRFVDKLGWMLTEWTQSL